MNQRLEPEVRRAVIITAAITLANEHGLAAVTHDAVARSCSFKTTGRTVKHYFPRISELWKAVVDDGRAVSNPGPDGVESLLHPGLICRS